METLKNIKIGIIADIQSQVNKQMKEWCAKYNPTVEKRSAIHGDSVVFTDTESKRFKIEKDKLTIVNLFGYSREDQLRSEGKQFARKEASYIVNYIKNKYSSYAQSINDRESLANIKHGVKFIYHGVHFIDEDNIELQYGLTNIVEEVDNIEYV